MLAKSHNIQHHALLKLDFAIALDITEGDDVDRDLLNEDTLRGGRTSEGGHESVVDRETVDMNGHVHVFRGPLYPQPEFQRDLDITCRRTDNQELKAEFVGTVLQGRKHLVCTALVKGRQLGHLPRAS